MQIAIYPAWRIIIFFLLCFRIGNFYKCYPFSRLKSYVLLCCIKIHCDQQRACSLGLDFSRDLNAQFSHQIFSCMLQLSNSDACPRSSAKRSRMRCGFTGPRCGPPVKQLRTVPCSSSSSLHRQTSCLPILPEGEYTLQTLNHKTFVAAIIG